MSSILEATGRLFKRDFPSCILISFIVDPYFFCLFQLFIFTQRKVKLDKYRVMVTIRYGSLYHARSMLGFDISTRSIRVAEEFDILVGSETI